MSILDDIITYKREEIVVAKAKQSHADMDREIKTLPATRSFTEALRGKAKNGFAIIAEIKKASPSKGLIREEFNVAELAKAYEAGGAACLSVLTDGPSFQGATINLISTRYASSLPILRKDFMIDPYQIAEARLMGADCVLLIMACLEDTQAAELEAAALEYNLGVLIESHDANEFERALKLKSPLMGVNNRNLKTFETSLTVSETLAELCPDDRMIIAESGLAHHKDLQRLSRKNIRSFLVGESLMRQKNVEQALRALLQG
jgi:indole-3-glycerol phosphate synthase